MLLDAGCDVRPVAARQPSIRRGRMGRAPRGAQVRPFGGLSPLACLVLEQMKAPPRYA